MELNHLPSGYEPPALTDELQPRLRYYNAVLPVGLQNYSGIIAKASHKLDDYAKDKHSQIYLSCPSQVPDV